MTAKLSKDALRSIAQDTAAEYRSLHVTDAGLWEALVAAGFKVAQADLEKTTVSQAEIARAAASKAWKAAYVWAWNERSWGGETERARDQYLAREHPSFPRKHEGDFLGVPLYSDPTCQPDCVVFEYSSGATVSCALIHPDNLALRRNKESAP